MKGLELQEFSIDPNISGSFETFVSLIISEGVKFLSKWKGGVLL